MTKILPHFFLTRVPVVLCLAVVLGGVTTARAETPDEWIKLLTRVHGGFGSFLPVGIRIGEDAMKRLDASRASCRSCSTRVKERLAPVPPMA
jgi:hypothetical protein